jgi:hypothetical protein
VAVEVTAAHDAAAEAVAEAAAILRAASISLAEARVLLAHAVVVRGHRRQTGDLPVGGEGSSRAHLQDAGVHSRAEAVSRARAMGIID